MIKLSLFAYSLIVSVLLALPLRAEMLPQHAEDVHLGVATCASSMCHGSVRPRSSTSVLQNEYVVWSRFDRHRNAYNILLSDESYWIAKNMGLENAHEAKVCLDCHADNVAHEKRGDRFQITDGIGCEACHGGAERYLSNHTDPGQTHQDNIDDGMYPTDRIEDRVKLCFSCHIGDDQKIASHEIMGAGHPRLSFELDTFGALQPAHYLLDEDYQAKKWSADHVTVWTVGQIEAGYQTLMLIESHLQGGQLFPELSLFDCHACHHAMSDLRWQRQRRIGLPPGSVRINDSGFAMLYPIARLVAPSQAVALEEKIKQLHLAVVDKGDVKKSVHALRAVLETLKSSVNKFDNIAAKSKLLLDDVVNMGAGGDFHDYVAAEQAVMAVDLLMRTTGEHASHEVWLDQLYSAVEDEDIFDPYSFSDIMQSSAF
jgi:hypothetical protein